MNTVSDIALEAQIYQRNIFISAPIDPVTISSPRRTVTARLN